MATPTAHKPRRKAAKKPGASDAVVAKAEALIRTPSFPLAAFLWPARGSVSQWEVLPLVLMAVGLFRWAAGLWGYSGTDELDLALGANSALLGTLTRPV